MKLPKMIKIHQHFAGEKIKDIEKTVFEQLSLMQGFSSLKPSSKIAITAGSRGIANIALIIRSIARYVSQLGHTPIIIPSMGSHGGATAEGQVEVLESLGVTENFCEAKILSSMDVFEIGKTSAGVPVYMDHHAFACDRVIVVNRIKVHTDFKSSIESGVSKMATIGLGKHKQALALHSYGIHGIRDIMTEAASVVFKSGKVLCGIGIVENALEQTAMIETMEPLHIKTREAELLKISASLMPKLPVENIDILLVDKIGKNYSGTGMDTNIIGRLRILGVEEPKSPNIKYIIARDVSEESHGNALGIGLADLTTQKLFDKIDYQKMNENVITSTFLARASIPIVLENDYKALEAALRANWSVKSENARIVWITNTLELEKMYVSEALLPELSTNDRIEVAGSPFDFSFDATGELFHE